LPAPAGNVTRSHGPEDGRQIPAGARAASIKTSTALSAAGNTPIAPRLSRGEFNAPRRPAATPTRTASVHTATNRS
jgi:hypothetical protein